MRNINKVMSLGLLMEGQKCFLKVMDPSVVTLIKNNRVRTPLLLSASHYHPRSRDPFFRMDRKLM